MSVGRADADAEHPRLREALTELRGLIGGRYPEATFDVFRGEDPEGVYLLATVDVEDTDEVAALYTDRLVDLQVDEGLPIYVLPIRPLARVTRELRAQQAAPRAPLPA
jgi:hypothetical protein